MERARGLETGAQVSTNTIRLCIQKSRVLVSVSIDRGSVDL